MSTPDIRLKRMTELPPHKLPPHKLQPHKLLPDEQRLPIKIPLRQWRRGIFARKRREAVRSCLQRRVSAEMKAASKTRSGSRMYRSVGTLCSLKQMPVPQLPFSGSFHVRTFMGRSWSRR